MISVTIDSKKYGIPTSWADCSYLTYARLQTKDISLEQKLSYQTGIPQEVLSKLPLVKLHQLLLLITFYDNQPQFFDRFIWLDKDGNPIQVGSEPYLKMEQSRNALEQSENHWLGIIEVIKTYTGTDITNLPVAKSLGYAVFFLNSSIPS